MADAQFWGLIGLLDGVVTPDSLDVLRDAVLSLSPAEIEAFDAHLADCVDRLAGVDLRYNAEEVALGDARRALDLAAVGAGREVYEAVLAHREGPVRVPLLAEFALELSDVARHAYEDKTDSAWPDSNLWEEVGRLQVVSAYFPQEPLPESSFILGAQIAMERWCASAVYADAVLALGYHALWCVGSVYDAQLSGAKRGTRSRTRAGGGVVHVDFTIDMDDVPDDSVAAGERFVVELIDKLARRFRLPTAAETLAPPFTLG